ncbi:hypothetical protein SpAn4DRAFT_0047 [Sporomusa ovata]|uniref:Uncharacterized protein n=1 Tax=Sporomusa ovata TaxID=2378 RepID=A0A0U1L215_9FIRM|nr:hypothetical protein SpAn4DRAFT_0047 [Sporomusa ovata]
MFFIFLLLYCAKEVKGETGPEFVLVWPIKKSKNVVQSRKKR